MFAYTLSLGLALVLHHVAARLSYVLLIPAPAVHGYHDVFLFISHDIAQAVFDGSLEQGLGRVNEFIREQFLPSSPWGGASSLP